MSSVRHMIDRKCQQKINPKYIAVTAATFVVLLFIAIPAIGSELSGVYCPVTTSELAEEQFSLDYQGQQIYFCCNKCKKDFLSSPETYLANLESSKTDSSQSLASHDNDHNEEADGHDTVTGVTTNSSTSHDHNTDHGEPSSIVTFAGKFHPMLTHFPIALVISALVFSILAVVLQIQTMDHVSVYSVYLAALTGIGTVILGLAAGSAANYPTFLSEYLGWHRLLGVTTGIVTILTAFAGRRYLQRFSKGTALLYRIALVTNVILVSVTGHFGATLVFGPDHFNF